MVEAKLVFNRDKYNKENARIYLTDLNKFIEVLISINPVYNWLDENIGIVSYKLLKGFITNIVPLGDAGKKYFKVIAHKKTGFTIELWKLYTQLEKMNHEGSLKTVSYLELLHLGYTGCFLDGKYPVDDVIKYAKN